MKSLTLGFFYLAGLSWALAETCVIASNGNWTPLILYLIGFILMFSILGCIRISDRAVDLWGGIFAILLAVGLVYLSYVTWTTGAVALAGVKTIFAIAFVVVGLISMFLPMKSSSKAH